jgi:alpha/beta superfamily hydrolase
MGAAMERRALAIEPLGAGPTLDAVLELPVEGTTPRGCVVVCHPHPLYGGDRESSVVRAIADGALAAGLASLRFDFRGVGASTGAYDEGRGERGDARAALACAAAQPEIEAARVALAGYSFGGGVAAGVVADALAAGEAGPPALALVASSLPPPDEIRAALVGYAAPLLLAVGERDTFASADAIDALVEARAPGGAVTETLVAPDADHFWLGSEGLLAERTRAFFVAALTG